ncbi:MAG TPA: hypothetical protein VHX61_14605 [Rhizomicrobium sp.]|jgi:hypothetical protein|nr:hypothetical protein [Rhizomicrobium sp.]
MAKIIETGYRLCVLALLAAIAFLQISERRAIEDISFPAYEPTGVQQVEIVNKEPLPVDAYISVKTDMVGGYRYQEPIPVKIVESPLH